MFNLLEFQKDAKDDLTEAFTRLWKQNGKQLPLTFKSPTGSGKTLMVAHFIRGLNYLPAWDGDKAFIWITFSDNIAMQSKNKFSEYFENTLENALLTVANINKGKLQKNDILFLNWQKVVTKSAENRLLRRPESEEEKKEQGIYFEDFVDNTKKDGREIILVIDEAHTHVTKDLAQQIIDYINPKIILHVTATPRQELELKSRQLNSFIEVKRERVVGEGLIKERIVVQTEEDLKKYKGVDLDEVLIGLGLNKKNEIIEEYKKLGKNINPLVLIQLPNDDKELIDLGQKTKEEVVTHLLSKNGVKENRVALWFDGKEKNMEHITENEDTVDFMLFKLAAGTGWDCPRAHILIRFREIQSETFDIQTVGRILRMPEPQKKEEYKKSILLKTGFLFTNYERNKVAAKWNEISSNKLENNPARIKRGINNIELESEYISRVNYGDLKKSAKFQNSFLNSMNMFFKISEEDILDKIVVKLEKSGVELKPTITNQIIVDAKFEDFDQLCYEFKKQGHDISLEMSQNDIEKTFNYYCFMLLKEQTEKEAKITNIARSWSPLKSAIRVWLKNILGDNSDYYYRIFINDINKGPSSVFRPAITQAIKDYRPILQKIIEDEIKLQEQKESPTFTIQPEYWFSDDYEEIQSSLCVLDKCYLLKDYKGKPNETNFLKYIDTKEDKVEWWFKNRDSGQEYYAIKYWNSEVKEFKLFYPDWIIRFKDGRIGIFDTKAGSTGTSEETKDKAKALSLKLKELGENYIRGIAIFENGIWYYNDSEKYSYTIGKLSKDWKKFEDIFK